MIRYGSHAGFTITSSKIQLVEIDYRNSSFILQNIDEVYFDEHINLAEEKDTKIISVLQSAFNEILLKDKILSKTVSFTLPPEIFYTAQLQYDKTLLPQDLIEEIRWEFSVLYPFIPIKEMVIRYIEIEKNNFVNRDTILVSAIKRRYLQWLKFFCDENDLRIKFIDNSHFASERALTYSHNLKGVNLSLYLTSSSLSLLFSADGKPFLFKTIPCFSAGEITGIILKETLPNETVNINRSMIDSVYIAGEDISKSFADALSSNTGIEIKLFNPFEKINPDPKLTENIFFSRKFNSFSSAAGISYRIA